ncbi:MAG: 2-C-methyl-D-erythritol 4-phosphate cytidylyltransferase [Phycisphaerae bacterium]
MAMEQFSVILPAAGSGSRFGAGDKLLAPLAGLSVLQRAVLLFATRSDVAEIIIVTQPDRFEPYREHLSAAMTDPNIRFVAGGQERWESVWNGLQAVREDVGYVAIHDAARPLTPAAVIADAFAAAVAVGGSLPTLAEPYTLKRQSNDGKVTETVARAGLYQAQTPQCFRREWLLEAFASLHAQHRLADVTDDAQIFERTNRAVQATAGSMRNIKITTPEDTQLALALLASDAPLA